MGREKTKTIIRVQKQRQRYVIVDKSAASDPRLSLEALGLHYKLMCKPDDWRIIFTALAREARCGERKLRSLFAKLAECEYAMQRMVRNRRTKALLRWENLIFETPELCRAARQDVGTLLEEYVYPRFSRSAPVGTNALSGKPTLWEAHYVGFDRLQNERVLLNQRQTEQPLQKSGVAGPESALPTEPPIEPTPEVSGTDESSSLPPARARTSAKDVERASPRTAAQRVRQMLEDEL